MPDLPRGVCPRCGRSVALRDNGTMRQHRPEGWPPTLCPGSGEEPRQPTRTMSDALFRVTSATTAHVHISLLLGDDADHRQFAGEIVLKPNEWEALKALLTSATPPTELLKVTIQERR